MTTPPDDTTTANRADDHTNASTLRAIYTDLNRLRQYCDPDVVLHAAERDIIGCIPKYCGVDAVMAKEADLLRLTHHTLMMELQHVYANDSFGVALGIIRTELDGRQMVMPFCGLWRFRGGRIVEHWENAYDPAVLNRFLAGTTMRIRERNVNGGNQDKGIV